MGTYKITTKMTDDFRILLDKLPFKKGEQICINIDSLEKKQKVEKFKSLEHLKGTVLKYKKPYEPVV